MKRVLVLMAICLLVVGQAFAAGTRTFVKSTGNFHGSSAKTWTPEITGKADIQAFTFHYSAGSSSGEDIRVILDSELGATYDTVIASSDSAELNDWFWQPDNKLIIEKDDNIRIWVEASEGGTESYTMTLRGEYQ